MFHSLSKKYFCSLINHEVFSQVPKRKCEIIKMIGIFLKGNFIITVMRVYVSEHMPSSVKKKIFLPTFRAGNQVNQRPKTSALTHAETNALNQSIQLIWQC